MTRLDLWANLPELLLLNLPGGETAKESGWQFFPQRFDLLGVTIAIWLGAWAFGCLALRGCGLLNRMDGYERNLWGCAIGLPLWSLTMLGLGAFGVMNPWLFRVGLVAVIAGEAWLRWRSRVPSSSGTPFWERRFFGDSKLPLVVGLAVAPFLMAMLLGAMLPPTDFDVREYHLEGPKEYYLAGRIQFLPHNVYTSFPFCTEMLHVLGMVLRGDWYRGALVGQTALMGFAPLTAAGLFYAGRRWFSDRVGWLAVLIFLNTPWTYRISIIAYTEGGLAAFVLLSLVAVLRAREEWLRDAKHSRPWFLLAGFLAGCGPACKYPGAISVAIPMFVGVAFTVMVEPVLRRKRSADAAAIRADVIPLLLFLAGGAVAFGPWLVKNFVETGNPFYPLMYSVFGGRDWDAALHAKWQAGHPLPLGHLGGFGGFVSDQWQRFLDVFLWNDWQTPFALATLPLAVGLLIAQRVAVSNQPSSVGVKNSTRNSPLAPRHPPLATLAVLLVYLLWLFETWCLLSHRIDRFWVPMLPILGWVAAVVMDWILGPTGRDVASRNGLLRAAAVTTVLGAVTLYHLGFITSGLAGNNAFLLDEKLAQNRFRNASIAILEDLPLPPRARVLFVGEAEVFEARFDNVYNTVFDRSIFQEWFSAGPAGVPDAEQRLKSPDEIRRILRKQGITHVSVNWNEILRYRPTYTYTDFVHPDRFRTLVDGGVLRLLPRVGTYRELARIPADQRAEVDRWAPGMVQMFDGKAVIPGVQVYEVLD